MPTIGFRGTKQANYTELSETHDILDFTVESYEIGTSRGKEEDHFPEIGVQEVIEVEYKDGTIDFLTKEDLEKRQANAANRGISRGSHPKTGKDVLWVDDYFSIDSPDRGLKEIAVKALRIFKRKDKIAALTVETVAKKVDAKNIPDEGLFYCHSNEMKLDKKFDSSSTKVTKDPYLLMIHGFASNSEQSFFGLSESQNKKAWNELTTKYPERILAYDHRSLTKSPLQNAAELVDSLAPNMVIDLLSYSRGGLVAEIFVKAAEFDEKTEEDKGFWEYFNELFEGQDKELDFIERIKTGVKKKNLIVRNYVRTACPAGGTILASDRLVLYLKVILNAIGLIPAVKAFPPYGHLKGLIIAIVQQKENTTTVPGIEALDSDSNFVKGINLIGSRFPIEKTPLNVISGDVMFGKFKHTLTVLLADTFFLEKNDFVVDTASMFQGFGRMTKIDNELKPGFYYSFHRNKDVSHFNYFRNSGSQDAILVALNGQAKDSSLFKYYDPTEEFDFAELRGRRKEYDKDKPTVIIIPGIMGSHLEVTGDRVWLDFPDLVFGGMKKLKMGAKNVEANGAIGLFYNKLRRYLSGSHNVIVHGFDWRSDLQTESGKLKDVIENEIKRNEKNKAIRIIAHSMGGLLVQALYSLHKDIWGRLKERNGFRTIFFGTPFGGSHAIINIYLKKHSFYNILHKIDVLNNSNQILDIINEYVGMLQLLPIKDTHNDFFSQMAWQKLQGASTLGDKFKVPSVDDLRDARAWKELISKDPIEGEELIYVAGKDKLTPTRVEINSTLKAIKVIGTVDGDGAVPWETGITSAFSEKNVFYMNTKHQALLNNKSSFSGIKDLLSLGTTTNVQFRKNPIQSRGKQKEYEMPDIKYPTVNNELDLQKLLMGEDHQFADDTETLQEIHIHVTHGDLGFAEDPVVVGHYEGDKLLGAEWAVDYHLGNKLQQNLDLGVYPGKLGESLVVLSKSGLFRGALVVGLGNYNKRLTEKGLQQTCIKGLVELALQGSRQRKEGQPPAKDYGISFLLVGSSYGGLDTMVSLRAIIRSVMQVNKLFQEPDNTVLKPYNRIEIIELYEDKAIQINKALLSLKLDSEFKNILNVSETVKKGTAGILKVAQESQSGWWHKVQITEEMNVICSEDGKTEPKVTYSMKWASLSDKARAEVEDLNPNKKLVDTLVAQAVKERSWDPVLAKTLFELLVPNEFKGFADDLRNIKIIVDDKTASYPWELLNNTIDEEEGPMVAQTGFIRQLYDTNYRPNAFYTTDTRALVVGDPIPTAPYQSLEYAREEGKAVHELLKDRLNFEVEYSEDEGCIEVTKKLFANPYKIIHFAGHGEYDEDNPENSGLILSDDVRITPSVIHQMPSVPDLVFINCCHLGKIDPEFEDKNLADRHKLAANLGTQFIRNGVKAVVVAGWAVDDKAAGDFANTFYDHMRRGDDFGTAVQKARRFCYTENKDTNTWGAYQCYGNPHYRLTSGKGTWDNNAIPVVHKKEVIIELENIARRAEANNSKRAKRETNKIDKILAGIKESWKGDYEILDAAGWAYYKMGAFEKTRAIYDGIFKTNPIDVSYRARRNYLIALTSCLIYEDDIEYEEEDRNKYIKEADDMADLMLNISDNTKIWGIAGGHEKRKLHLVTSSSKFRTTLKKCVGHYYESYKRSLEADNDVFYGLINFLIMIELYALYANDRIKLSGEEFDSKRTKVLLNRGFLKFNEDKGQSHDFWDSITKADLEIAKLLVEHRSLSADRMKKLAQSAFNTIAMVWKRGGSWRKLVSVRNHYMTIHMILEKAWDKKTTTTRTKNKIKFLKDAVSDLLSNLDSLKD